MKRIINEEKIEKEVDKVKAQLEKDGYFLTTKGTVRLIVNLVEEQSNEK